MCVSDEAVGLDFSVMWNYQGIISRKNNRDKNTVICFVFWKDLCSAGFVNLGTIDILG